MQKIEGDQSKQGATLEVCFENKNKLATSIDNRIIDSASFV